MEINKIKDKGYLIFVEVDFKHGRDKVFITRDIVNGYNVINYTHASDTVRDNIADQDMYDAYELFLSSLGKILYLRSNGSD